MAWEEARWIRLGDCFLCVCRLRYGRYGKWIVQCVKGRLLMMYVL